MRGIIIYEKEAAEYNASYINQYIEEGKQIGIHIELCLLEELIYGVKEEKEYLIHPNIDFKQVKFAINRTREVLLSKQLERLHIHVFNSSMVCEICNDKARTYQHLAGKEIKMIDSVFLKNHLLAQYLEQSENCCVVKAVSGHGGSQVCLYQPLKETSMEQIQRIVETMRGDDVVVQPLIEGRRQDLRVYIIGNQIVASVLRTAKEDFRANFSLGGSVQLYELKESERQTVEKILHEIQLDYAGIDFLIGTNGELIFNEIEDVVGARMLYQCSDINIVREYLMYIKNTIGK